MAWDWRRFLQDNGVLLAGVTAFAILGVINHVRDFTLWRNYCIAAVVMSMPIFAGLHLARVRVPYPTQAAVIAATAAHFVGGSAGSPGPHGTPGWFGLHGINGAYHVFGWWDHLTHGLGIGATTMGYAYLLDVYQGRRRLGWTAPQLAAMALVCGLATGVLVELYEYLGKTMFQTIDQGGYANTMTDLNFNLLGATLGALLATGNQRTRLRPHMEGVWGHSLAPPGPWWARLPPTMAGLAAAAALVAAASFYHGMRFLFVEPHDSIEAYDQSLNSLTLVVLLAGLAATFTARRRRGRGRSDSLSDHQDQAQA